MTERMDDRELVIRLVLGVGVDDDAATDGSIALPPAVLFIQYCIISHSADFVKSRSVRN